ncbi:Glycogen synthase kinase-3 [Tritrichomonas foetus]|uniref:Glycogen synthase kinase-3 n=1 Tax=Tritrichomonas foetus TaxID=1144522 RepID=A0A1J4KH38_9EUKA|nr:Glycogen synthase kinase-3 [Tritrichomonas foetus]|eukprot:OHT08966.1 Glycogen synthase kinase-3 [Tritrichomonas foetus]
MKSTLNATNKPAMSQTAKLPPRKTLFNEIPMREIIRNRHILHQIIPKELSSEFKPVKILGRGEHGVVIEAINKHKQHVAIKCVLDNPNYKNRELQILKSNISPLCITLLSSFITSVPSTHSTYINYVTELMPMTLRQYFDSFRPPNNPMPPIMKKLFAFQLFSGLAALHKRRIIHRDINMENILIDPLIGRLKIIDFGSAKFYKENEENVSYIMDRPYRAPELIYGSKSYGTAIDIWAAGCIYAELLKGMPLFHGATQISVLHSIARVIGPPKRDVIESYHGTEQILLPTAADSSLEREIPLASPDEIHFLKHVFRFDPKARLTGAKCMEAHCFDELFNGIATLPNHTPLPILDRGGYSHLKKFDFEEK